MANTINPQQYILLLEKLADVLINDNPKQDYNETPNLKECAEMTVTNYKLGEQHLYQLLQIREEMDRELNANYKVKIPVGLSAYCFDVQRELIKKKVPQKTRVMVGLSDEIIGVCNLQRVGL